jgi:L-alanine-DL-glutamate epimerase-like enolase superfamily enzyme
MAPVLELINAHRLVLPLAHPYRLSFATLDHFEIVLVAVRVDGREGLGDCVPLPGYSPESADSVWTSLKARAPALVGRPAGEALAALERDRERRPFAAAPLMTAIETALEPLSVTARVAVPLVGTVGGRDGEEAAGEAERLLAAGYETLKVKVGWDPLADARRVARIQRAVAGRARLRIDANQAWDLEQARRFIAHVEPTGIEHFEQPFPPDAWEQSATLARMSALPLMLDESIDSEADLERAVALGCAQVVKFKLAKAGGLTALERLIRRARAEGLGVVLGNGVAGDIENLYEALVARRLVDGAGEMNGFLKPRSRLLRNPYEVVGGRAVLERGYVPEVDWELVAVHAIDGLTVRAEGRARAA